MTQLIVTANDGGAMQANGTWAQACDGTLKTVYPFGDGTGTYCMGCDYWQGSYPTNPNHHQMFFAWDTSSIPEDATISAVTLTMTPSAHGTWSQVQTFECYKYAWYDSGGNVDKACWRDADALTALYDGGNGLVASFESNQLSSWEGAGGPGPWEEDENCDWTAGSGAIASITKAGTTRYMMTVNSNRTEVQPTIHCREFFYLYGATPSTNRPTLTITYTEPSGFTGLTVTRLLNG